MNTVKKVFITGGTSGIGAAIARAFATTGASVTATGATPAEVAAAQALPTNRMIAFHVLDVRQNEHVQNVLGELGEFDVLVNCAGIIQRNVEHDPEVFAQTVDINLNGTMRACAAAREGLKARRGCIVNTASMLSFFGGGLTPGYSASKGGVVGMTLPIARDLARNGIRNMTIAPGIFGTPMLFGMPKEVQDALAAGVPFPSRLGTPADYAKLVKHIVENDMLNGEVIRLDGAIRLAPK